MITDDSDSPKQEPIEIGGQVIYPGQQATINLPVVNSYTHTEISMPIRVIHGKTPGPRLFVCAATHGDEINGVAIIRRLLQMKTLKKLKGTLIAVPIVNVLGFHNHTRYLPDRRDLNRSFPGSEKGSLAARLAYLFIKEVVDKCTHGIDLHTGAIHRANLPQIRACMEGYPETEALAIAFGAPVILEGALPEGSLRQQVVNRGLPMLLFEGGEALRFDERAIRVGMRGVLGVMSHLGMFPAAKKVMTPKFTPLMARSSFWVRAPESGIIQTYTPLGKRVQKGDLLGIVTDTFGENRVEIISPLTGIVIGRLNLPLVNEGDAMFHIASFGASSDLIETLEAFKAEYPLGMDTPPSDEIR